MRESCFFVRVYHCVQIRNSEGVGLTDCQNGVCRFVFRHKNKRTDFFQFCLPLKLLFLCSSVQFKNRFIILDIRTNFFHSCTPLKLLFLCPIQKPDFPPLTPLILVFLCSFVEPGIYFYLSPLPRNAFRLRMRPSYFARFTAEPLKSIR